MARTTTNNDLRAPLYATLGATDRAVEIVRDSVSDLQTRLTELQQSINKLERDPQALRVRATREAQERRAAIEARVNELRSRALAVPTRVQTLLAENEVAYSQLVARGDALVRRVRRQKSTQDTVKATRTASSKAKTTATQASKAGRSTAKSAQGAAKSTAKSAQDAAKSTAKSAKSSAKSTSTTARRQSQAPKSSAKATSTSAAKAAKSATKATADAAKKVGG